MIPDTFTKFKKENVLWKLASNKIQYIPMWTGWNTKKDIHLPPATTDIVKETRKCLQVVAGEFGQKDTLVPYDLTMTKIAKGVQCEETPQFDVFIMFGSFLIEMSFFFLEHSDSHEYLNDELQSGRNK